MNWYTTWTATTVALLFCGCLTAKAVAGANTATAEALLRGGIHSANDQDENEGAGLIAKFSDNIDFARKSYFQFDVSGENMSNETTLGFELLFPFPQIIQPWALNQAYPTFSADLAWDDAQANDVEDPSWLLEDGDFTASLLGDEFEVSGLEVGDIVSIPLEDLSAFVFDDVVTLVLTGINDLGDNGGMRIVPGSTTLTIVSDPGSCSVPDGRTPGDLDGEGGVAFADFLVLSGNFGQMVDAYEDGDIDCNGAVDFADFLVLSGNFGTGAAGAESVPEPTSSFLLVFGSVASIRRRRRY